VYAAFTETLKNAIESSGWLAPWAALIGGITTAANPCVIAMVPLMVAFVAGQTDNRSTLRSLVLSLTFAAGLTITFSILFMATWATTSILRASWWGYVASAVCLLMGLHLLGLLDIRIPAPKTVTPSQRGLVGALLLGMLFGLVSLPCAGPILIVLLSIIPLKGTAYGATLLAAYSIGHCVLILVAGTSMGAAQQIIASKGLQKANTWIKRLAGVLVLGVGIVLLTS